MYQELQSGKGQYDQITWCTSFATITVIIIVAFNKCHHLLNTYYIPSPVLSRHYLIWSSQQSCEILLLAWLSPFRTKRKYKLSTNDAFYGLLSERDECKRTQWQPSAPQSSEKAQTVLPVVNASKTHTMLVWLLWAQDFWLLHDSIPWYLSLCQQSDLLIVASLCRSAREPPSFTCLSIGISERSPEISKKSLKVSSPQRLRNPMQVVVNMVLYLKAPIRNILWEGKWVKDVYA